MPWTEKHRPKKFSDIVGQKEVIERITDFIKNYKYQRKKALLLAGPPGIGKTTLAMVAAKETEFELFEMNASSVRNKAGLQEILKPVLEQQSLMNPNKIILIDEVDGISGTADRGGIPELVRLIEKTNFPIILTANDAYKRKLSPIRKKVEQLDFIEPNYSEIKTRMLQILEKEDKKLPEEVLTKIALKANGDIRAAINDLESASKMEHPEEIMLDNRNKATTIIDALKLILKGKPMEETKHAFDSIKEPLDEVMLWMEKNVPIEYTGADLARAFDKIAKADVFKGRIYHRQYWRFLVYQSFLLSYGVSASKKAPKPGFAVYKKPTRILKIWMSNIKLAKKKSICQKYCKFAHIGSKRAMQDFNIIKPFLQNPLIQEELKLSEDEIAYLNK